MNSNLAELDQLKPFLENFSATTGCTVALAEHDSQELLFIAGQNGCCLKFHCTAPESKGNCRQNHKKFSSQAHRIGEIYFFQCNKHLLVGGTPVILNGRRVADLNMGQVRCSLPNGNEIKLLTEKFGYPRQEYVENLATLPVVDQETFRLTLQYLAVVVALLLESRVPQPEPLYKTLSRFAGEFISYGQLVELADDAIFICTPEGRIQLANQCAARLSGYDRNELVGQNIAFLFSKEHLRKKPLNFDVLSKAGATHLNRCLTTKNGTTLEIEIKCMLLPNNLLRIFIRDISELKRSQKKLLDRERDLETSQELLKETNIALRVMVREAEQDKKDFEEKVSVNLLGMVNPYLGKLNKTTLDDNQKKYLQIIESSLSNIVSPFVRISVAEKLKLSPTEIRVANLLKQGLSSKEISRLLILSPQTVDKHRGNIRKKFGITNQKVSLKSLLESHGKHKE